MKKDAAYKRIVLHQLQTINGENIDTLIIEEENIKSINETNLLDNEKTLNLYFDNAVLFPGLINSHDHLDFDLFPKLGNKTYADYLEWGKDIHLTNKNSIRNVLKVPENLRVAYGVYKNLLAGVTTVVHHGKYVSAPGDLIDVYQRCNTLHSVRLQKYWKLKLNNPFVKSWPFVIHIGEGTNQSSHEEINELLRWNILKRKMVGIHGIAMKEKQANHFKALVWCPASNLFLQSATAAIDKLKTYTTILFGTDSTLSADWNIWSQLQLAQQTGLLTDNELWKALTINAAITWKLNSGMLEARKQADVVIARRNTTNNIFAFSPESILLVISKGRIVLFDEALLYQLRNERILKTFSKVFINNCCKYVKGEIPALIKTIKSYSPDIILPVPFEYE